MTRALLIAGDEWRFGQTIGTMSEFLAKGPSIDDVTELRCIEYLAIGVTAAILKEIAREPERPLLIVYSGHGFNGGWAPTRDSRLGYPELCRLITMRTAPTLLVNACCYPAAIFSPLEMAGASSDRVAVIAAGPADKVTYEGLVERVIESWRSGKIYEPKRGYHPVNAPRLLRFVWRLRSGFRWRGGIIEPWNVLEEVRWGNDAIDRVFIGKDRAAGP
ncbi:MAG: hypothetical protein RL272_1156 [Candidatus Parcubacteria bacterium]